MVARREVGERDRVPVLTPQRAIRFVVSSVSVQVVYTRIRKSFFVRVLKRLHWHVIRYIRGHLITEPLAMSSLRVHSLRHARP
jgi:hypothetical protein